MEKHKLHLVYMARRILPMLALFMGLQALLRLALIIREAHNLDLSVFEVITMFGVGLLFDFSTLSYFILPYMLYLVALPAKFHLGRFDRWMTGLSYLILTYLLFFDSVAEWVFWDEFSVRYNFIAVDYLVYTQEVLGNIWESYPIPLLLSLIALVTGAMFLWIRRFILPPESKIASFRTRLAHCLAYCLVPVAFFFAVNAEYAEITGNSYADEITKNGIFSLFSAFRNNSLNFEKFYMTAYKDKPLPSIRELLKEDEMGQTFVGKDPEDATRKIVQGKEIHKNVIIVTMESMSAAYMDSFGNGKHLTPSLDGLAKKSLFFTNFYATGTRTVRGLEAVSLSIPPAPGQSILKRPNNENLASIGFVFRDRGYDTRFIYGGHGYFDNMNYFFSHNGFDAVDRGEFADNEVRFSNIWGVADEDLFAKVIQQADTSYKKGKHFMHVVMTTSNHRPYTFPSGIEGIKPEGGGREMGVKYADYSVGKFIEAAKKKPWFKDTVFIFVADHTASSAGKEELTVEKYHIPLIIYSPGFIAPKKINHLASQIDIAPTLLGLLKFNYYSKFYGEDLINDPDEEGHTFISNYQKLGFIKGDVLAVLRPGKEFVEYKNGKKLEPSEEDEKIILETIAYYRHAAKWRQYLKRIDTVVH